MRHILSGFYSYITSICMRNHLKTNDEETNTVYVENESNLLCISCVFCVSCRVLIELNKQNRPIIRDTQTIESRSRQTKHQYPVRCHYDNGDSMKIKLNIQTINRCEFS